jgi:hypothetical protein
LPHPRPGDGGEPSVADSVVTAGSALAALILALWGFSESDDTEDAGVGGWADRVYRAVGFFRFSGVANGLNWQLHVARVLAPLVIGYAAFQALVALFREQAQLISGEGQLYAAAFSHDGGRVAAAGDDGASVVSCTVCGPIDRVLARARSRLGRVLTPSERAFVAEHTHGG